MKSAKIKLFLGTFIMAIALSSCGLFKKKKCDCPHWSKDTQEQAKDTSEKHA